MNLIKVLTARIRFLRGSSEHKENRYFLLDGILYFLHIFANITLSLFGVKLKLEDNGIDLIFVCKRRCGIL